MAEAFIEEIYRDAMILYRMKRTVEEGHKGMDVSALRSWSIAGDLLKEQMPAMRAQDEALANLLWQTAMYCREAHADLQLFTARIEQNLIPLLMQYLKGASGIDVSEERWNLQSSASSFLTLKDLERGEYLHSPYDPMWENYELVKDVFVPQKHIYHVLGCGLGYFPYILWEESDRSVEIYLYENDRLVLDYASRYGVLDWIASDRLHIVYEENPEDLVEKYLVSRVEHPEQGSYIAPWKVKELHTCFDQELSDEATSDQGRRQYRGIWEVNVTNNRLKEQTHSMKELKPGIYGKEWVLVAAGPSVDDNMDFLRESVGKRTIIAVNTALRKLLNAGIRPDLLTVIDPTAAVAKHLDGVEEQTKDIPLLAEQLTNWRFIDRYQGPIYYIVSTNSSMYAGGMMEEGIDPWEVGGTVTSMAVTAAIRLGAEKVHLIGVDLGYPGHRNYAQDVPHGVNENSTGTMTTESTDGGMVDTQEVFLFFRSAIEQSILAHPEVHFYNRSAHGAYIHGTMQDAWWEKTDRLKGVEEKRAYLNRLSEPKFLSWRRQYYLFWQLYASMEDSEREELNEDLDFAYERIYRQFREELGWKPSVEGKSSGLTYIFSTHYERGTGDLLSGGLKREALQAVQSGKKVLLVATEEYLSGEPIMLEERIPKKYDAGLKDAEELEDGNRRYPYYMFPDNMPELRFVREFLIFMNEHRPEEIRTVGKYSLTADYARECFRKD